MQLAKKIIDEDTVTERQKVVVMFTDGEPNGMNGEYDGFVADAANSAISNSKAIKDKGATVYTIGCFNKTYADTSDVGKYMNYVSSNYPNATSMTNAGTKASDNFYKTVGSTADLDAIFQEISQTAGGATLTLGSETVLKDVVSEYFDLPENASSMITAQSYSCTGFDADGHPTWSNTPDAASYAVKVDGKNVSVTGFDYSANWVGKDTTTGVMHTPGKKLVVTIPIEDNGTGMGTVPTNGTDSAVYDKDGKQVCPFAQPTAYFPYFTVTHIQSNVDDSGKNYGKNDHFTKHRIPKNGEKFNLTSVVTENYLYGGSFTGENCDTVQPYGNGENPMAFTPVDQATYYIWEVPNTYLTPIVFVFCVVGTYALNNNILDIFMMMIFGAVAFFLIKCDFPMPPIILGLILGNLAEKNLQRALVISDGSISIFFTRPISLVLIIISVFSLLWPIIHPLLKKKPAEK